MQKPQFTTTQRIIITALKEGWRLVRHPLGAVYLETPSGKRLSVRVRTFSSLRGRMIIERFTSNHPEWGKIDEFKLNDFYVRHI